MLRDLFAKQSGANDGINKFPLSGGVCGHWSYWQKDEVLDQVHRAQECLQRSYDLWKACGRRRATWLAAKLEILGN